VGKGQWGAKQKGRRKLQRFTRERVVYDLLMPKNMFCGQTKKWMAKSHRKAWRSSLQNYCSRACANANTVVRCGKGSLSQKCPTADRQRDPGAGLLADNFNQNIKTQCLCRVKCTVQRYGWIKMNGAGSADCAYCLSQLLRKRRKDLLNSLKIHSDDTPSSDVQREKQARRLVGLCDRWS